MNCSRNSSSWAKALLFGGLFLISLVTVSVFNGRETKKEISLDEAIARLEAKQLREINLDGKRLNLIDNGGIKYRTEMSEKQKIELLGKSSVLNVTITYNDDPPPFLFLFQILFWLFLISPPLIVVLLLVIIKKMDAKNK